MSSVGLATTDWEATFTQWASPPSKSEQTRCENAINAIGNAVGGSTALKHRQIKVFVQGSYRNRVNVRQDSDVDVGVMCHDYFLNEYPSGMTGADFGNAPGDYSFAQFKNELEAALVAHFGRAAVHRGNKAFDVRENSYHVEADVVPLFEFRHYTEKGLWLPGVALIPDRGDRIENYPERLLESWPNVPLHYENGVAKNGRTHRAFKGVVRILKKLRNEMEAAGLGVAGPVTGFLIECLVWNAPDTRLSGASWSAKVRGALSYLWSNSRELADCLEWTEVNDVKYLFRPHQPWTREQAHAFIDAAWTTVGIGP